MTDKWYDEEQATLGDRLTAAREALGISQRDLAGQLGVKTKAIENWEADQSEPRANRLQMLAGMLNVSIMWLLTGQGDGLTAPVDEAAVSGMDPVAMMAVLHELHGLKLDMTRSADRIGRLETRLKQMARAA